MDELDEAVDRVIAGPERRSRVMTEEDKRITAYHEGGHALVGYALPNADPIHKVTIIPRGRAGGYTMSLPDEDRNYMRRSETGRQAGDDARRADRRGARLHRPHRPAPPTTSSRPPTSPAAW